MQSPHDFSKKLLSAKRKTRVSLTADRRIYGAHINILSFHINPVMKKNEVPEKATS
jgi:hypothetical protein